MPLRKKIAIGWVSACLLGICIVGWPWVPIVIGIVAFWISILVAMVVIGEG
jgi:O-antigen ligase